MKRGVRCKVAANGVSSGARVVSESEARLEAERLLSDPRLHVSDRHKAFLRYIVDATFEGRGDTIKAYSIAIDVFNRPPSFDPSSDPIVRIEATRLREALEGYYKELGDEPGARLDIPRGRYVPLFVERDQPPCPAVASFEEAEVCDQADPVQDHSPSTPETLVGGRRLHVLAAAGALVPMLLAGGYLAYRAAAPSPSDTQKPFVTVTMNMAQKDREAGDAALEDLTLSLARFGTVRLKSDAGAKFQPGNAVQNAYDIKMRYAEDAASVSMWWQVSDAATGEAVWTDEDRRPFGGEFRDAAMQELVYGVSRRLAGPAGIVNTIELRRNLPASTTGNLCVLRGEFSVELRDPAGLKAARPCLEATVAADPKDADALATLARVYLWTGRTTGDDSYYGRGLDLANRAAAVAPTSPRAALAQLAMQYQVGQYETAVAAGRRGVALNPENADLLAKLGMVVYLSGGWQEGVDLARRSADLAGQTIRDASFVMILDAYRQERYAEAVNLARQVAAADTPTTVLKLAAVARIGDPSLTKKEIAAARLQHPDLDRTVAAMLTGSRYDRDLEASLASALNDAGVALPELASNRPL